MADFYGRYPAKGGSGSGDVVGPGSSTNNAIALWDGTTGKLLKDSGALIGSANGVATLDSGGKVPASQLPNSVIEYQGTWSAATNTPTLADGVGNAGDVYINTAAGTVNFGAGPITFAVGDWAIYSGTVWQKSINSNAVASVNGLTGAVTLAYDNATISGVLPTANGGTGQNSTATFPASGVVVTEDGTETLTNKTLVVTTANGIRFYEDSPGTHYVNVIGPTFMSGNRTWTIPFGSSSNFVGDVATQTLSNKANVAGSTTFVDAIDSSKAAKLDVSGISTLTTRTLTVPDANMTLVGADTSQTLTNKTMSGSSNTFTNLPATGLSGIVPTANGGTGVNSSATFPTSGVVVTEAASEVLTNKTISGSSNTLTVLAGSQLSGQVPIANGGTGAGAKAGGFDALSPMSAAGDVIYGGTSGTGTRLAAGTTSQFLKGGTTPSWSAVDISTAQVTGILPLANGGTAKNNTAAAGAVAYSDASGILLSAVGTNGMRLKSTGTTAPAFAWSSVNSTSAAYSITTTDGYDGVTLTGTTSRQIDLPAASSSAGRRITLTNLGTSSAIMTIARAGSDTIGPLAETSILLSLTGDSITLVSDGTSNWAFVGDYYQSGATSSTFTFNGSGGTSSSISMIAVRRGSWVSLFVPAVSATSGTSSTVLTANSALPSWTRPLTATATFACNVIKNNGTFDSVAGEWSVSTAGVVQLSRNNAGSAWANSASGGSSANSGITYFVGTGS